MLVLFHDFYLYRYGCETFYSFLKKSQSTFTLNILCKAIFDSQFS